VIACIFGHAGLETDSPGVGIYGGQLKALLGLTALVLILALVSFVQSRKYAPGRSDSVADYPREKELYTGYFIVDRIPPRLIHWNFCPVSEGAGGPNSCISGEETVRNEVDITDVPGIGPRLYERLRPYLKITAMIRSGLDLLSEPLSWPRLIRTSHDQS